MFSLVKKLKMLKSPLKKLAWENDDVFDNVKKIRKELEDIQGKIDKNPNDKMLREE